MRIALFCIAFALAACVRSSPTLPPNSHEIPDSEFELVQGGLQVECYESLDDALAPLVGLLKAPPLRGERGVSEFSVTRRENAIVVVDSEQWDSGDDGRSFWHERQIFELGDSGEWCQTRVLHRQ